MKWYRMWNNTYDGKLGNCLGCDTPYSNLVSDGSFCYIGYDFEYDLAGGRAQLKNFAYNFAYSCDKCSYKVANYNELCMSYNEYWQDILDFQTYMRTLILG